MKFIDEYRQPEAAQALIQQIRRAATRRWKIMEVCGGQTHTLIRSGIDELLSEAVQTIHGPGCPVCVTPLGKIDRALAIASRPSTILATYGDMMRVPGSAGNLLEARSRGADVRMVYSPTDALLLAENHPDAQVVFFAVGFETTAPANAMSVWLARRKGIANFSLLVSHVRVPPAIDAVMADPDCQIQGFLGPGHVCSVMGFSEYERLAERHRVPFVVTGFEPLDLLEGILLLVRMLEQGRHGVENQYSRSVRRDGNAKAREIMDEVFEVTDMPWRGMGPIPGSGLKLRPEYARFDAELLFPQAAPAAEESKLCIAGQVLQGKKNPLDCPAFARQCTPESPLGAPMVSSEGACAAYYAFRRFQEHSHGV